MHSDLVHKEKADVIVDGELEDVQQLNLELDLPIGDYDVFFVLNSSNEELLIPTAITKPSDLYTSNVFSNKEAEIFGYSGQLSVTGNMTSNIVLQRLYSQIKVEFTDDINLSVIKKVVIKQEHEPFFYSPFITSMANPILDQSSVELLDDFQLSKQLVFNQFMGLLSEMVPVNYSVGIHGENEILRTFELTSPLKNNVQLVFRGQLLPINTHTVGFQIKKNENWDSETEVYF